MVRTAGVAVGFFACGLVAALMAGCADTSGAIPAECVGSGVSLECCPDLVYPGCDNECFCDCTESTCTWGCTLVGCLDAIETVDQAPPDCVGHQLPHACCAGIPVPHDQYSCCNECYCSCGDGACQWLCTQVACDCGRDSPEIVQEIAPSEIVPGE